MTVASVNPSHKLLVVEDEVHFRSALRASFTARGCEVDCAGTFQEAAGFLNAGPYAAVIADVSLDGAGGTEGLDLAAQVRETSPGTYFIALTGQPSPGMEREARRRGVHAFLLKSKPLAEVAQVVFELIGKAQDRNGTATYEGPISVPAPAPSVPLPFRLAHTPGLASTATAAARPAGRRQVRIALYSHDTMGLGHARRNLLIAQTMVRSRQAVVLMVTGAREAGAFAMPQGMDMLTLPALFKGRGGGYQSRSLGATLPEIIELRAQIIRAALAAFDPDLLIVDNVPRGAVKEMVPALDFLRARGRTRCVLGLRDVLDEPAAVRREWASAGNQEAIRDSYDAVWIYGDRAVFDPVREYSWPPEIAAKVQFTGYLDQRVRLGFSKGNASEKLDSLRLPPGRLFLCLMGGGQDGASLAEVFVRAEFPPDASGVILTGPCMPPEVQQRLHALAAHKPHLRVIEFLDEPTEILGRADRVVAMGGYNTVSELLSFEKHALIVPRVSPRREQLIRAERLRDLGLVHMLHPGEVSPETVGEWLARDLGPPPTVKDRIDLMGLARLPRLVDDLVGAVPAASSVERRAVQAARSQHAPHDWTRMMRVN